MNGCVSVRETEGRDTLEGEYGIGGLHLTLDRESTEEEQHSTEEAGSGDKKRGLREKAKVSRGSTIVLYIKFIGEARGDVLTVVEVRSPGRAAVYLYGEERPPVGHRSKDGVEKFQH